MATEAARAIEAILMVAQEPVDPHLLAQLLEVAPARVTELCDDLRAAYEADDRGFVLVKVAGGYRFQSHADLAPYVERFVLEGQSARLSAAALETLAIVAYKQPISRAQVAAIRGVNVDGVMRTLQGRGYVDEVGRDPGPGQATLFGTTREFLERLGLDSLADLPPIADLLPDATVLEALEKGLRPDPVPPLEPPAPEATSEPSDGPLPVEAADHEPTEEPTAGPSDEPEPGSESRPEPAGSSVQPSSAASAAAADDEPELPAWFDEPAGPTPGTTPPAGTAVGQDDEPDDEPDVPERPDERTPDGS
jgi:segregation and condensation protein B